MLIALLRANSGNPFFQYRFNLWQKITLSKNSAIIWCYSEVMTSPFYIVKLDSFTIEGMPTRAKKGLPTEVTFWTFRSDLKHCASHIASVAKDNCPGVSLAPPMCGNAPWATTSRVAACSSSDFYQRQNWWDTGTNGTLLRRAPPRHWQQ